MHWIVLAAIVTPLALIVLCIAGPLFVLYAVPRYFCFRNKAGQRSNSTYTLDNVLLAVKIFWNTPKIKYLTSALTGLLYFVVVSTISLRAPKQKAASLLDLDSSEKLLAVLTLGLMCSEALRFINLLATCRAQRRENFHMLARHMEMKESTAFGQLLDILHGALKGVETGAVLSAIIWYVSKSNNWINIATFTLVVGYLNSRIDISIVSWDPLSGRTWEDSTTGNADYEHVWLAVLQLVCSTSLTDLCYTHPRLGELPDFLHVFEQSLLSTSSNCLHLRLHVSHCFLFLHFALTAVLNLHITGSLFITLKLMLLDVVNFLLIAALSIVGFAVCQTNSCSADTCFVCEQCVCRVM